MNLSYSTLTIYVFFVGTFVWFNEILAYFINNDSIDMTQITLVASASYTISFILGYFNSRIALTLYIILTFSWFRYNVPQIAPQTQQQLRIYDMVSETEFEHQVIASLSHSFAYVLGCVMYENNACVYKDVLEYASIIGLIYLVCGFFGTYIVVASLSFVAATFTTIHYGVFKHLNTNVMSNTAIDKCPMYNDGALILYQTYPVCGSIIYLISRLFSTQNVALTHMFRAFWYYNRQLPVRQFFIETALLVPTIYSSVTFNYFYLIFTVPILTQILRNPAEVLNGCLAIYDLQQMDSSEPAKFRDNLLKIIHTRGAFRIPLLDASYIATDSIPKTISQNSNSSTTSPFLKGIVDIAGTTLFSRDADDVWSDLKKELRTCIQHPTFSMIDNSTDQLDLDEYKNDNGYEIFNRIISRVMMTDIAGIEMTVDSFESCYEKCFNPERESMISAISGMCHLDDQYAIRMFNKILDVYNHCTRLRTDGWVVRLLFKKHDIVIDNIEDLKQLLKRTSEYVDMEVIHTINEATLMFLLAVPTTASLSSRCVHLMNYIRDTDVDTYNVLMFSAHEFYKTYRTKDETLKKPIKNDMWVDFVVNTLYWWPPTMVSVKLVRKTIDIYHPGDIITMSLNCDRNAPPLHKTQERYDYMMRHPQVKPGESLWQDDRICAGAYFAQNEAAFILAKLYSNYNVSIGEGKHNSYMVNRIDYPMRLHEK